MRADTLSGRKAFRDRRHPILQTEAQRPQARQADYVPSYRDLPLDTSYMAQIISFHKGGLGDPWPGWKAMAACVTDLRPCVLVFRSFYTLANHFDKGSCGTDAIVTPSTNRCQSCTGVM